MKAVTSITIDPTILAEAQDKAKTEHGNLSRAIEQLLRAWLNIQEETTHNIDNQLAAHKSKVLLLERQQRESAEKEKKRFKFVQEEAKDDEAFL